jgi:phage tail sheath protein FI
MPVKVQSNDFVGNSSARTGLEGLEIADDVTMVCCPDLMSAYQAGAIDRDGVKAVQLAMIAHCERMADRMAILDPLPDLTPQEVKKWRESETNYDSKFAALYYPWIMVSGPDGKPMPVPPSGHMAGVWARNDSERGVHKAPANEVIRTALNPAAEITKGEQDVLNPIGVNCIRSFAGRGVRVWGARTLSSDPAWRYINVRRLFNYVEKSIENGTQWVVFEPNDPGLWARVRRDVGAFMTNVWRDGMLFGLSPQEAFFVKCDAELNPPESRDLGRLVIEVGMAPVKPAEFVIFRFSQFSGGGA